jgi:hypothetical protein
MNAGEAGFDLGVDGTATLLGRVSASPRQYGLAGLSGRDCAYQPSPPSYPYAEPFVRYSYYWTLIARLAGSWNPRQGSLPGHMRATRRMLFSVECQSR